MYDAYIERLQNKPLKHLVMDSTGRVPIDHADAITKASDYIGSWLVAKKPISIFDYPGGTVVTIRKAGENVGRIYSYLERDGAIWWQLEGNGFVKHGVGSFDTGIAMGTGSGAQHQATIDELNELTADPLDKLQGGFSDVLGGAGNALSGFGKNLNMIIILLLVAGALVAMYKLFKM